MKLVYIYGPPAVGKLTVAEELEKEIGFKIFHNHKTFDIAHELFEDIDSDFWSLLRRIRLDIIEEAGKRDVDLIYTNAYVNHEDDNEFVKRVVDSLEEVGGKVCFVKLSCKREELLKRVNSKDRQGTYKITDKEQLKENLDENDYTEIPFVEGLNIDVTDLPPEKAVEKIIEHFDLDRK